MREAFPDRQALWRAVLDWHHARLMGVLEHEALQRQGLIDGRVDVQAAAVRLIGIILALAAGVTARGDKRHPDRLQRAAERTWPLDRAALRATWHE